MVCVRETSRERERESGCVYRFSFKCVCGCARVYMYSAKKLPMNKRSRVNGTGTGAERGLNRAAPFPFIARSTAINSVKRAIRTSRRLPSRASDSWRQRATAICTENMQTSR